MLTSFQAVPRCIVRVAVACGTVCTVILGLPGGAAVAFPATDVATPSFIPPGAPLAAPDLEDLQRQMGLTSGFASLGSAQGWTILPRISAEEEFTDNARELAAPRTWDLTTILAPGVAVLGNSNRVQLRLDYEPDLEIHLRTGSQNILAQQLNAVGSLTVVPDLFYIDLRAVSGAQATNGGFGGVGGIGQTGIGGITGATLNEAEPGGYGLARQNRTETSSFSVSPYLVHAFGDIGTARIGASLTHSTSEAISSFAPMPFVAGNGTAAQSLTSFEENAQFVTGNSFAQLRDTFTADAQHSIGSGIGVNRANNMIASDRLDYQWTRSIDIFADLGWQNTDYQGINGLQINGPTWHVGTVLTPNADSELTLSYGHQNGDNTFSGSGRYALTARTILTASYNNGIGTQLEQVSQQLGLGAVSNNGTLVNANTGGPLFLANNALAVQPGVFRYSYLTVGETTVLDRDTINMTFGYSKQTRIGNGTNGTSNAVKTFYASWMHEFSPALVGTASGSLNAGNPAAGTSQTTVVVGLSLQYILTPTVSTFARYSFYDIKAALAAESWYQDLFLVGITKQF